MLHFQQGVPELFPKKLLHPRFQSLVSRQVQEQLLIVREPKLDFRMRKRLLRDPRLDVVQFGRGRLEKFESGRSVVKQPLDGDLGALRKPGAPQMIKVTPLKRQPDAAAGFVCAGQQFKM